MPAKKAARKKRNRGPGTSDPGPRMAWGKKAAKKKAKKKKK